MTPDEKRAKRIHDITYSTDDREELAERIVALEELVRHMYVCILHHEWGGNVSCENCQLDNDTGECDYDRRMDELGIEVD